MSALSQMTIGQICSGAAGIIALLSIFIEITPIKFNPVSKFLGWLGKKINSQVLQKVTTQGQKLDDIDKKIDENEIDRLRWEILDFANSCRNHRLHSKDEFEHIIKQNQKYHDILEKREMENGLIDLEYAYIEEIYKERLRKNDFL